MGARHISFASAKFRLAVALAATQLTLFRAARSSRDGFSLPTSSEAMFNKGIYINFLEIYSITLTVSVQQIHEEIAGGHTDCTTHQSEAVTYQ